LRGVPRAEHDQGARQHGTDAYARRRALHPGARRHRPCVGGLRYLDGEVLYLDESVYLNNFSTTDQPPIYQTKY
jgi:hypothetical protein